MGYAPPTASIQQRCDRRLHVPLCSIKINIFSRSMVIFELRNYRRITKYSPGLYDIPMYYLSGEPSKDDIHDVRVSLAPYHILVSL